MSTPSRPHHAASTARKPRRDGAKPGSGNGRKSTPPAAASTHLNATQRRYLRGLCHSLKPVILLGNKGVTAELTAELGRTLDHHELVKVKLSGGDRGERRQQIDALLDASGAELVQQIGHVASLYRRNPEQPRLALP